MAAQSSTDLIFLLDRTAIGDRDAFAELYSRTAPLIFAVVLRICRDYALAEDVTQEAYIKVWTMSGAYDAGAMAPLPWLANLARTTAIDQMRRVAARPAGGSLTEDGLVDGVVDLPSIYDPSGRLSDLRNCLNLMPDETRRMVLHSFYNGTSLEELAERFERPVPAIRQLMRRTVLALKRCIDA